MIKRWLGRRACMHHDRTHGYSWIEAQLINYGRGKMFRCTHCEQTWFI